ncbi:MAG: hypothetical protein ABIQ90_01660 [Polaromonas sp.]
MHKFSLSVALLFTVAAAQATQPLPPAPTPAQHPITGSWSWNLPGKKCAETWHYRADGTRSGSSGEETTRNHYEIAAIPSLLGFYRVVETVTESNRKRDCSGDLHEAPGEPVTRFIQFSPKRDQLLVCKAESLKECFGPLQRSKQ